jgi:DNA repair exonuclease SbcCD nuclease subunit
VRTYGLLSDVHATRRPPINCTETYWPDLFDLLTQAFAVFRERAVTAAVIAGDVFHHKAPTKTDHALVGKLGQLFLAQPFPVWVVPGNHDMQFDRISSVSATQPLGVLFGLGAAHCLDGWMGGRDPVFGVPWQQHWSAERIAEALRPWEEQLFGRSLVVAHAPIYPPGSEPRYDGAELTPADWWAAPMEDGSMGHGLFYGHIHESHGTWQRRGIVFCNYGALSRGSLGEDNLTRQVGVTLWGEDTGEFEFVPLDARPAEQVFRLAEHGQAVTAQASLGAFLDEIGSAVLPVLTPDAVMKHIRSKNPGPEAVALAEELIEWAQEETKR